MAATFFLLSRLALMLVVMCVDVCNKMSCAPGAGLPRRSKGQISFVRAPLYSETGPNIDNPRVG